MRTGEAPTALTRDGWGRSQSFRFRRCGSDQTAGQVGYPEKMVEYPRIRFRVRRNGKLRSSVADGLEVWEYVMTARTYSWDRKKVASHLNEPQDRIDAALEYYQDHPAEVDEYFEEMRNLARNWTPPVR